VAQRVVGDVEDVVGLVIGQVDLEQVQSFVDGLGQPDLLSESVNESDAAVGDGPVAARHVVVDDASREHGSVAGRVA
jgi:hypothetical protein